LAIVCPEARFVSVEPVGKKAAFQRQVAAELSLTNLEVVNVRVETLERPVDLVTCRAFASLADFLSLANGLIGPDTWVAAMKGQRAEIDAELKEIDPASPATVLPLQVPFIDAQRHLVLLPSARARMAA
jgi:16S rRNA (guanine527-N7)-methyltransferase